MTAAHRGARAPLIRVALISAVTLGAAGCGAAAVVEHGARDTLAPCPSAPHCVSSSAQTADQHVEPILYRGPRNAAQARLVAVLQARPRTRVVIDEPGYLRAESTSALLRFVDDLECVLRENPSGDGGLIELRSASRVGYYDFGANRDRVEAVRRAFAAAAGAR